MSFESMKKASSLGDLTKKLTAAAEKMNGGEKTVDDRFWKPTMDKTGNGYAVIRFLPAPDGEDLPWAKMFSHAFQGPGGWYIENSLTTIGGKDPVTEYNRELWGHGEGSAERAQASKQKRKLSFYSNIYVVKDPANPQNEGHVFLYKFGRKIFDKIMEAMQPEFEDEQPINPFDFWEGANFKLKLKKVAGYWNYDSSEFASTGPLLDDDEALEAIWKKQSSLTELVAADQFKDFDTLQKRLDYVVGVKKGSTPDEAPPRRVVEDKPALTDEEIFSKMKEKSVQSEPSEDTFTPPSEEEEDPLSYFQKLADS